MFKLKDKVKVTFEDGSTAIGTIQKNYPYIEVCCEDDEIGCFTEAFTFKDAAKCLTPLPDENDPLYQEFIKTSYTKSVRIEVTNDKIFFERRERRHGDKKNV